jgi:hypothetical protein
MKKRFFSCSSWVVACSLYLVPCTLFSQQFGGNPPSIKWKQIDTDTARIIFPEGLDSTAQRVSNIIHYLARNNPAKLGPQLRKVNIVLQTQSTIGNGYVSLAPFRSEFQITPITNNFDLGSISWPDALSVHEYRHVQQFNNFRNGLSNLFYYLFGESGWLVGINISVPDWFYEGDAVYNETITTNQGRGRIPYFLNQYKSLWLYDKNYSWMKLRNGSLKDYVPNHYPLGYLLVNYGREKYGLDFWAKITKDASAFKGLFYPFQHAVKKYSGQSYKRFRNEAFEYYKRLNGLELYRDSAGKQALNGSSQTRYLPGLNGSAEPLTRPGESPAGIQNITTLNSRYPVDYFYPYQAGADSLLYLKSSYRQRDAFYMKNSRGEHRLRVKDISLDEHFSYRNGKIVYAAYETDPRWGWRDYSVIRILDKQGKQRTLAHKTKYFKPDISPDGKLIAAVQILPGGKSDLLILDSKNGIVGQKIHSAEISLFTGPKFVNDSLLVTAVRLNDGRMTIALTDVHTGVLERLVVPTFAVIGNLSASNRVVYFTASYSGNDEVYALQLSDRKVFRLTNTALGNYFANANEEKIVWSGFTPEGYQLREMNLEHQQWVAVSDSVLSTANFPYPVAHSKELHDILLNDVPNYKFPEKRYIVGEHLFYFHSWRPYYDEPEFTYSIFSDNILNNFSNEYYYRYNQDENSHAIGWASSFAALYPMLNTGIEYTFNRTAKTVAGNYTENRLEARLGFNIPLNFTRGRTFRFLNFGSDYVLSHRTPTGIFKDSLEAISNSYLHHFISWSHYAPKAVQHIFPKFGYTFSANLRHWITDDGTFLQNAQWLFNGQIFLPSIQNHSLVLSGSYQRVDTNSYTFSNRFVLSRGYDDLYFQKMWRLSVNYHFPIAYPDFGFANLVYLQRLRVNLFYDYSTAYTGYFSGQKRAWLLRSGGAELYFDTKWWNEYPLTFGVRYSHLLDNVLNRPTAKNVFEILIPIVIPN